MTKFDFLGGCALMALVAQAGTALADDTQRDLMIALDVSKSNVVIEDGRVAAKAASTAAEMIRATAKRGSPADPHGRLLQHERQPVAI